MQSEAVGRQVDHFFSPLTAALPMIRAAQQRLELNCAPNFNMIERYIRPQELDYSRIFADLLNPMGPHGQSTLFLDTFVKQLVHAKSFSGEKLKAPVFDASSQVLLEYTIKDNRRIDILIQNDANKCVMALENKPHAIEQDEQINDYINAIINRSEWFMVYLPGDVSYVPKCRDTHHDRLVIMPYNAPDGDASLVAWLKCSISEIKAPNVRFFVDELIKQLETFPKLSKEGGADG